jgi:hypothetical protein
MKREMKKKSVGWFVRKEMMLLLERYEPKPLAFYTLAVHPIKLKACGNWEFPHDDDLFELKR